MSVTVEENSNLEIIGSFHMCTALKEITIPPSVVELGSFSYCSSLKEIKVPAGVTTLYSFVDCASLESVTFEEGSKLNKIEGSFAECSSLHSLVIPAEVTRISMVAFRNSSLQSVIFEDPYGWSRCVAVDDWRDIEPLTNAKQNAILLS